MNQEDIIKIQLIEQEVNNHNEQLRVIEQNISDMNNLNASLEEIRNENNILVNLGKNIFIPVEVKDKKLIINVGKNNLVKKTIPETNKLIESQINNLIEVKRQIMERLEVLQNEIRDLVENIEKEQKDR